MVLKKNGHEELLRISFIPAINSVLNIGLQVLFVEAHGGYNRACGPVYHDICQEVIQTELPVPKDGYN